VFDGDLSETKQEALRRYKERLNQKRLLDEGGIDRENGGGSLSSKKGRVPVQRTDQLTLDIERLTQDSTEGKKNEEGGSPAYVRNVSIISELDSHLERSKYFTVIFHILDEFTNVRHSRLAEPTVMEI
jgi:hypothetical protein